MIKNEYITLITAIISAAITLYTYHKGRIYPISKERLEKLYAPLFNMLENYLFNYCRASSTADEHISAAYKLMKENIIYADSHLIETFYTFMQEKDFQKKGELFDNLSELIVSTYSKLSREIGVGGFTPAFRANRKLYGKKSSVLFKIEFALYFLVLPMIGFAALAYIFYVLISCLPYFMPH